MVGYILSLPLEFSCHKQGTCILRPETSIVLYGQRPQYSMSHTGAISAAGGRHSRLLLEETRFSGSHFPPYSGKIATLLIPRDMVNRIIITIYINICCVQVEISRKLHNKHWDYSHKGSLEKQTYIS